MSELATADLFIREISVDDAAAIAILSEQLGYPVSPEIMQQRTEALARLEDHIIFVACLSGQVVGWIELSEVHHLTAEPRAEIGGLIVSSGVRNRGIGHRLLLRAEEWARLRGLSSILVRSRIVREGAHRFYLHEAYAETKTSVVFSKELT